MTMADSDIPRRPRAPSLQNPTAHFPKQFPINMISFVDLFLFRKRTKGRWGVVFTDIAGCWRIQTTQFYLSWFGRKDISSFNQNAKIPFKSK